MEKTPQQTDSPDGNPAPESRTNQVPDTQEIKGSAKKIIYKPDSGNLGMENLPPEASELFKHIMSNNPEHTEKVMMESMTPEQTIASAPQMDQQAQDLLRMMVMNDKPSEKPVISETSEIEPPVFTIPPPPPPPPPPSIPPPPPAPSPVLVNEPANKFSPQDLIIDERGAVFGIQINKTKKREVIEIMKSGNNLDNFVRTDSTIKFDDIGINFHFGDEGVLQEITFSYPFEGSTRRGLEIGNSITKAIELYGQPKMRTQSGAIWDKISIFLKDDTIISIRLRSN
jgi:hypothetical protein